MNQMKLLSVLALAAFVSVSACATGDEAEGVDGAAAEQAMPGQVTDAEMMELMVEMQMVQQKLEPIQQEAMQDEALVSQLASLQIQVETAMREEDPELFERIGALESEMTAAQESGDDERLQALSQEAQGIQQSVQALQMSVLDRPEIREPLEAFEAAHRARMIEIDPEAEELLARAEAIMSQLEH